MAAALTLTNIPDALYARLERSAETHRRSLADEAIACIETALDVREPPPAERIARIRALRSAPKERFRARDIDDLKRRGRP